MDMYETIMDMYQEMEEQIYEYVEMQYKVSDTPTAAKDERYNLLHQAADNIILLVWFLSLWTAS